MKLIHEKPKTGTCEICKKSAELWACEGPDCAGPTMIWACWACVTTNA